MKQAKCTEADVDALFSLIHVCEHLIQFGHREDKTVEEIRKELRTVIGNASPLRAFWTLSCILSNPVLDPNDKHVAIHPRLAPEFDRMVAEQNAQKDQSTAAPSNTR